MVFVFTFMTLWILSIEIASVISRSLEDAACRVNPIGCSRLDKTKLANDSGFRSVQRDFFGTPSSSEFEKWMKYEETASGTGLLRPEYGTNPVPYGRGLGDININTGLGVEYPFGSLGIERNFGISMGGNGRIGGFPIGWGNGQTRTIGSAPWANQ